MNDALLDHAARLRREFDHGFAGALRLDREPLTTLLAIRLRGEAFALRLSELDGLFTGRTLTPLPGPAPALLGLAGVRGAIVPVYDLGALLGHPAATATPRWLALAAGQPPIGFAFDAFEATLQVRTTELAPESGTMAVQARELARTPAGTVPVIQLAPLRATLIPGHHPA